jgi:hypothetical protein
MQSDSSCHQNCQLLQTRVGPYMRYDLISRLSGRKRPHGRFVLLSYIRQCQFTVNRQTLLHRMPTEQLQLWTDDAVSGQMRDELVPEEVWIDSLGNSCSQGVLFDELPHAPCGVRSMAIRFKEIERALGPLAFHVLGELPLEARRNEHVTILLALPPSNPHLASL